MDMTPHSHREINDHRDHRDHAEFVESRRQTQAIPARIVAPVVYGSGWYHDAAIEQASRDAIELRCNPYG